MAERPRGGVRQGGVARRKRRNANMYFVYVIQSNSEKIYTGHTIDLQRRLSEHNNKLCKTTKIDRDWKLVYYESFSTRGDAMKREKWLKTGQGRRYLKENISS